RFAAGRQEERLRLSKVRSRERTQLLRKQKPGHVEELIAVEYPGIELFHNVANDALISVADVREYYSAREIDPLVPERIVHPDSRSLCPDNRGHPLYRAGLDCGSALEERYGFGHGHHRADGAIAGIDWTYTDRFEREGSRHSTHLR